MKFNWGLIKNEEYKDWVSLALPLLSKFISDNPDKVNGLAYKGYIGVIGAPSVEPLSTIQLRKDGLYQILRTFPDEAHMEPEIEGLHMGLTPESLVEEIFYNLEQHPTLLKEFMRNLRETTGFDLEQEVPKVQDYELGVLFRGGNQALLRMKKLVDSTGKIRDLTAKVDLYRIRKKGLARIFFGRKFEETYFVPERYKDSVYKEIQNIVRERELVRILT